MKNICFLIAMLVLVKSVHTQNLGMWELGISENFLEIKIAQMPAKKVSFSKASGDWYIKKDDASTNLKLEGTINGNNSLLEISWDGLEKEQELHYLPLVNENRFFMYREQNAHGSPINLQTKNEDDRINITVIDIQPTSVSFSIEGHIAMELGTEAIISGKFSLQKRADQVLRTDKFGDCDPVVYNKIPGAQDRTASDCELKFDAYVDDQFYNLVIKPVKSYFLQNGFSETFNRRHALKYVGYGSGKRYYVGNDGLMNSDVFLQNSSIKNPFDPDRQKEIMDSLEGMEKAKGIAEPDMSKIIDETAKITQQELDYQPSQLKVICRVNGSSTWYYGGTIEVIKKKEGIYIIRAGKRKGETVGTGGESTELRSGWTIICIGHFKPPVVSLNTENTYKVSYKPEFTLGSSHLSVQAINIHIEGNREISDKVLQLIDWEKLYEMVQW